LHQEIRAKDLPSEFGRFRGHLKIEEGNKMTEFNLPLKKYDISIEYCVPCDYSAEVLQAVGDLLSHYQHIIGKLVLIMGTKGVLDVKVNSEILFSKKEVNRHPKSGEILQLFKSLVGPKVPTYDQ